MKLHRLLILTFVAPLLAACAPHVGEDLPPFGASVRHAKEMQTYRPGQGTTPTLRGDRAASTIDVYRSAGQAPAAPSAPPAQ